MTRQEAVSSGASGPLAAGAELAAQQLAGDRLGQLVEELDLAPHQFSMEWAKIPAISSSSTGRGQVASRRCCFIVPGTRSGMSASV